MPKSTKDSKWKVASAKAKMEGTTLNDLIKKRKNLTKGTEEYAKVQNKINKFYGVKKRHKTKSSGVGRLDRDKVGGKVTKGKGSVPKGGSMQKKYGTAATDKMKKDKGMTISKKDLSKSMKSKKADKTLTVKKSKNEMKKQSKSYYGSKDDFKKGKSSWQNLKDDFMKAIKGNKDKKKMAGGGMVDDMMPKYEHGGKVEGGGMFDFPSMDARSRSKKSWGNK